MNIRPATILWIVMFVIGASGLYMVKYKVQALKLQVAATERDLREEKKNLHVLAAEWTYLNRPDRLQRLSTRYLSVTPMHGEQLADYAGLPFPAPSDAATQPASDEEAMPATPSITLASGAAHGR